MTADQHVIRRRKRPALKSKDNASAASLVQVDDTKQAAATKEVSDIDNREVYETFLTAAKKTPQATFWKNRSPLAECISQASLALSLPQRHTTTSLLLLEESSIDLINHCRLLVKAAKSETEAARIFHCLTVSVHGLRALASTLEGSSSKDSVIKLLYHCIVISEAQLATQNYASMAACHCLAAGEALAVCLVGYPLTEQWSVQTASSSSNKGVFPAPKQLSSGGSTGGIPLEQVISIAIASMFAVAKVLVDPLWNPTDTVPSSLRAELQRHVHPFLAGDQKEETSESHYYQAAATLIQTSLLPWIFLLGTRPKSTKEVASHCKRAHRLLWKVAGTTPSPETSLFLRGQAIAAFLATTPRETKGANRTLTLVQRDHFEDGCKYAWTAALAHVRTAKGINNKDLLRFHRTVGTVLDSVARVTTEQRGEGAYYEYCAYRALHWGPSTTVVKCKDENCWFHGQHYPVVHSNCTRQGLDQAGLALFFLSLDVRDQLNGTWDKLEPFNHRNALLSNFLSVVKEERSKTCLLRWFKLLSKLSLHHVVFQVSQEGEESSPEALRTAARILSECIASTIHYLIKLGILEDDKVAPAWDLAIENYRVASIAFEKLSEHQRGETTLNELASMLYTPTAPTASIEKAAKFYANLGRKRWEASQDHSSLVPLLHSIQLFAQLAQRENGPKLSTLQLSLRWSYLSSIYSSLELGEDAILTAVTALLFDIMEASSEAEEMDVQLKLLSFLGQASKGVVCFGPSSSFLVSQRRQNLATRLVKLILNHQEDNPMEQMTTQQKSALTPSLVVKSLLQSRSGESLSDVLGERCGISFSLGSILRCLITSHSIMDMGNIDCRVFGTEAVSALLVLLDRLGQKIVSSGSNSLLEDYKVATKLAASLVRQNFSSEEEEWAPAFLAIARSLTNVVASVTLLPKDLLGCIDGAPVHVRHRGSTADTTSCLIFAKGAEKVISEAVDSPSPDWNALLLSVRNSISLLTVYLGNARDGNCQIDQVRKVFEETRHLVSAFKAAPSPSPILVATSHCIARLASRLSDLLSFEGHGLPAAESAIWSKSVAASFSSEDAHAWLESTVRLRSIAESVVCVAPTFLQSGSRNAALRDCESEAVSVRVALRYSNEKAEIQELRSTCIALLSRVEDEISYNEGDGSIVVMLWARTTTLLGLAECEEFLSGLDASASYLKQAFEACKEVESSAATHVGSSAGQQCDADSWWLESAIASIHPRVAVRQYFVLHKLSNLQRRMGNYRKAFAYAESALARFGSTRIQGIENKSTLEEYLDAFQSVSKAHFRDRQLTRLALSLKASVLPLDQVYKSVKQHGGRLSLHGKPNELDIEDVFDQWLAWEMLGTEYSFHPADAMDDFCHDLRDRVERLLETGPVNDLIQSSSQGRSASEKAQQTPLILQTMLMEIASRLSRNTSSSCVNESDLQLLRGAVKSNNLSAEWRAKAMYLVGTTLLDKGCHCEDSDSRLIGEARDFLTSALGLLGNACDLTTRKILRGLALASEKDGTPARVSNQLINASIGRSAYRKVANAMKRTDFDGEESSDQQQNPWLSINSKSVQESSSVVLSRLADNMQPTWRFVSMALCPTGELLITSISHGEEKGELSFETESIFNTREHGQLSRMYHHLMVPLDKIIQRSQSNLNDPSPVDEVSTNSNEAKRKWWSVRKDMDTDLHELLKNVEKDFFSSAEIQHLLFGEIDKAEVQISRENLAARFEAVSDPKEEDSIAKRNPIELKVVELRDELAEYGILSATTRKMRKKELVELLTEERLRQLAKKKLRPKSVRRTTESNNDQSSCIFLILDENLQRFPFESMPCFDGKNVSRLPSLAFAAAAIEELQLRKTQAEMIDPKRVSYVLDPESNLGATRTRLAPLVDSLSSKYGSNEWDGVVGKPPPQDFMLERVTQVGGMLLYFGHGGGQQWLSRTHLQGLISPSGRMAKSAVMLMGCSSGRLESVNRRKTAYEEELPIHYEPEGIALSYLMAGAPCVVGNLWDVTDHDIDRFSEQVLTEFFDSEKSLVSCVAQARSACKLRYMVGCAPVYYGLPVCCTKI